MVIEKGAEETKKNVQELKTEDKKNFVCECSTLSSDLVDLLVKQLSHELRNHNLYMSFSIFYSNKGLNLLAEYYKLRAIEEYNHHNWIMWYLSENDVNYKYPEIKKIDETFTELIDPIKLTVKVEQETTEMIYNIAEQATADKDFITIAWLNGNDSEHGALILEQLEEESLSNAVLNIAELEDSWLLKEKTILELYRK